MKYSLALKSILTAMFLGIAITCLSQNASVSKKQTDSTIIARFTQDTAAYTPTSIYSTPWGPITGKDIWIRKQSWRTIKLSDKGNYLLNSPPLASSLIDILMKGLLIGVYKAYSGNGHFKSELKPDMIPALLSSGISGKSTVLNPATITTFRIEEDCQFFTDNRKVKVFVRIIGIAPIITVKDSNGIAHEQAAFWLYYPALKPYLIDQKVVHTTNVTVDNLQEIFEDRHFEGTVDSVFTYPKL